MKTSHARRLLAASIVAAAAFAGVSADARDSAVGFVDAAKAPEMSIIQSYYGAFLRAHPGVSVRSAQVDLQGKGVASVAVRFVGADTCSGDECETAVLFYGQNGWRPIFQHTAKTLALAAPAAVPGADNMSTLVVDGGQRWYWSGFDHYIPDIASLGDTFGASRPATAAEGAAALSALRADATVAPLLRPEPGDFRVSEIDLGKGALALLVRGYAPGLCSNVDGCPHALLMPTGQAYATLWTGFAPGEGAVLGSSSDGLRDIALADYRGYRALRFDGAAYRVVQTSYPSPVTPAP